MHGPDTTKLERVPAAGSIGNPVPAEPRPARRWWRGLTGALAAGLALLAVGVLVAQVIAWAGGYAGPGALPVVGHCVAAALALAAQYVADRRRGTPAGAAGATVALLTLLTLTLFWWQ
ncbi:hypothetical protein SAMN05421810_10576 [Amycolatopsis arida]|uniref:Uncharacterized protein n=1 Tax=Amycolatopsis arida TaxID=587909 RepID=A0A1I5WFF7_9PSEU|nr:hypothetical protein [Amycolatopsis arida]TDX92250.1 hypothetical protein CLV69_10595 [Amycolatopsis arida]SFQ18309.1 hypothetical protein SAMN05421810_10576 [Amycolatopsis arida]